ncbi:MAG: hypothetical protein ACLPWG_24260 [Steroidobacteraceae bacterium]
MRTTYTSRFSATATACAIAAAALIVPVAHLQAQQTAAHMDGAAGYNIACSIQAASGFQNCGEPPPGHNCDVEANYASQPSRESTGITFVNRSDMPVKVYWLNFRGERILYKSLPAGAELVQQTFVGHNWLVTSSSEQCIGIFETVPQSIVDAGSVAVAPPELPIYEPPSPPEEDLVWTPGFWAWSEDVNDYYWVPGIWAAAPIVGFPWTPGYWVGWRGGFAWRAGYWGPHVGFYGGINYGYGYFGRGYVGGSWRDGHMMYNSAVINLGNFHSNHTYSQPVANGGGTLRASYRGDNLQPNAAEAAAAGEYHIPPTSAQLQHLHAAGADPALHASSNGGHPAYGATALRGEFPNPAPPQTQHAGTLSFTHSAPPPRPAKVVAADTPRRDAASAAGSTAAHPLNQPRAPQPQEHAVKATVEPQPAPKENEQPHPKSSPAPTRTSAPHADGQHTP